MILIEILKWFSFSLYILGVLLSFVFIILNKLDWITYLASILISILIIGLTSLCLLLILLGV